MDMWIRVREEDGGEDRRKGKRENEEGFSQAGAVATRKGSRKWIPVRPIYASEEQRCTRGGDREESKEEVLSTVGKGNERR